MTATIYYVGFFRNGHLYHLESGPFIDWEDACIKAESLTSRVGTYKVVEQVVHLQVCDAN